ncbi:MAG: hypothetical protein WD826_06100 [Actinomycetota bacterium]
MSTLIVPRDTPARVSARVTGVVMGLFRAVARRVKTYEMKDRILAAQGAWFLFALLGTWFALLWFGYALIFFGTTDLTLFVAIREVGSSMLTLGFASTPSRAATVVDLLAAASGLSLFGLVIGYLPVLYGAFNRRERVVTMLESRAGAPAWGPELLWRHQRIGTLDSLPAFYEEWEGWCADVAETHSIYPVLLFLRSPAPLRSWLTGLLAVLDSAALYLAMSPSTAPSEARLCLRMGFTCLRTLGDTLSLKFDHDPMPDTPVKLSYDEYMRGVDRLREINFPMERSPEEAWPHFQGWRVNYEDVALQIAERIVATPGAWMVGRGGLDALTIPTERPVDRTPDEPEGTKYTRRTADDQAT